MFDKRADSSVGLPVPTPAIGAPDARELLRFWTANGGAHVSLSTVTHPDGEDGVLWGVVLADIARHAVNALCQSGNTKMDADALMTQITKTFLDELGFGRDVVGTIKKAED
ncbi:DUF5076 domain-containing protein [uncultured Algimonas sp.]|uniref:DUF5076 domain-containing protein n=1 Tax=uncultured Algimonas sp. TaxID=1547920 RepID=UPI00262A8DA6|nr:DUF5076 domain-containing protein [uncultured Algimonas sp.]